MWSVDLLNGLILFVAKGSLVLVAVLYWQNHVRDFTAATVHGVLAAAVIAVCLLPVWAVFLPAVAIPMVPPAVSQWLDVPLAVVERDGLRYHGPLLMLVAVYLLVACWLLCYRLLGIFQVRVVSLRARTASAEVEELVARLSGCLGLSVAPEVRVSDEVETPQVWGCRRPFVLLPAGALHWPRGRLRRVLIHELAHLQRQDWATKLLLNTLSSLIWFMPGTRSTLRSCGWYAELACDDRVVELEGRRAEYAADLLSLSTVGVQASPSGAVALIDRHNLHGRIQRVLDGSCHRAPSKPGATRRYLFLPLVLLLPLGALKATVINEERLVTMDSRASVTVPIKVANMMPSPDGRLPRIVPLEELNRWKGASAPPRPPDEEVIVPVPPIRRLPVEADVDVGSMDDPRVEVHGYLPLVTVTPQYPHRALARGTQGQVIVQFDIGIDGRPRDIQVVASQPDGVFDRCVLDALTRARFRPHEVNGQAVIIKNVTETFVFRLQDKGTTDNPPKPVQSVNGPVLQARSPERRPSK